jgi:hypothetical protein
MEALLFNHVFVEIMGFFTSACFLSFEDFDMI